MGAVLLPDWREEPVGRQHDRQRFDCGQPDLNRFLQFHARQSHEQGASKTWLAIAVSEPLHVLGFYTLSPADIEFARVPEAARRGLGKHSVGGFRLGRLAVDRSVQGSGLGGQLLLCAARRCIRASQDIGGTALIIDAKDDRAAHWYQTYGAVPLPDQPLCLILPYATVLKAFEREQD